MKERDEIEKLLQNKNTELDVFTPSASHQLRFLEKLKHQNTIDEPVFKNKRSYQPLLAIAASITLLICLGFSMYNLKISSKETLASVSPEMKNTQDFFTVAIDSYIEEINNKASAENKKMIMDTMQQLEKLEISYNGLEKNLVESSYDKRVISAMISNFQKRAALLENVLKKIDAINNIKTTGNGNSVL